MTHIVSAGAQQQSSGLLIIDKPQGVTSHDIVAAVRGTLHMKRVGHAGTLDPMATGVLVVGFGNATRLLNYIVDHSKTYEATIRLGQSTTTDDADGEVLEDDETAVAAALEQITRERLEALITEHYTGEIEQVPNTFSAIKINGQRAYDLAREGKDVQLQARKVTVEEFAVLDMRNAAAQNGRAVIDVDVRVSCSAGTYIRALARDLGAELGVGGHLTRLRRTRVGDFHVDDSRVVAAHTESRTFTNRDGEEVTRNRAVLDVADSTIANHMIGMLESAASTMPALPIDEHEAADLRFGRRIARDMRGIAIAYVPSNEDVVAIVERAKRGEAKPIVVFAQ